MKRGKTWLIILGLILTVGLGAGYYFYGLFTPYNYFTAQADIRAGKVRWLTCGLPLRDDGTEREVAKEFGFEKNMVAGCEVTPVLLNGVDEYNRVVFTYIEKKNGLDWREKFNERVRQARGKAKK